MDEEEIYAGCARLRRRTADWLETLTDEQLATRSLCPYWTVRDVAGHLVAGVQAKPYELLADLVRSGFRLNRANVALAHRYGAQPRDALVGTLREQADRRLKFPGVGALGPLIDLLVHGGDMRLPLGVPMPDEPELTAAAMDQLVSGFPGLVPRRRLRDLRLVASDLDRSWRAGQPVEGTLNDLVLAVTGRPAVLHRLTGSGVGVLAGRID